VVERMVSWGLKDPQRVGCYGWSYGGYLALMCATKAPSVFSAAVAGAPVVEWEGYDTAYTERYMSTPAENAAGYAQSSVLTHLHGLQLRPLLVHGWLDENVHVRHTLRLVSALTEAGKPHELLLINERHLPRGVAVKSFLEKRILAYFNAEVYNREPGGTGGGVTSANT
jgi:dipeptidyl-peptidase 4